MPKETDDSKQMSLSILFAHVLEGFASTGDVVGMQILGNSAFPVTREGLLA